MWLVGDEQVCREAQDGSWKPRQSCSIQHHHDAFLKTRQNSRTSLQYYSINKLEPLFLPQNQDSWGEWRGQTGALPGAGRGWRSTRRRPEPWAAPRCPEVKLWTTRRNNHETQKVSTPAHTHIITPTGNWNWSRVDILVANWSKT